MRRTPAIGLDVVSSQSQIAELINRMDVFDAVPVVASMEVGEIALGDGTEAAPAAGSNALYFKPDAATIVVISSDGSTLATRNIT